MLSRLLHRHLVLPAYESLYQSRRTLAYWRELERTQWLDPESLREIQFAALQRLMLHAQAHCPYYRDEWSRLGLDARDLRSLDDFAAWPSIGRDDIRLHRQAMRSTLNVGRLISKATGGSSGVPLQFDCDPQSHERRTAASLRGYEWAGAGPGTRQLYLWGVAVGEQSLAARWKTKLYHAVHHRRVINCFDGGDGLVRRFLSALGEYRPDAIVAYVNPLYEIARRVEEGFASVPFRPRTIVVGAEKLHPFQREVIERAFGATVYETYGSREFMLIGAECECHRGLHLTAEHLLVEILDEHGHPVKPGEEGDVVVTDLFNRGMPFIRYQTHDRAVAESGTCACGRGLPLLRSVRGRRLDMLVASHGRTLPGEFFPHLIKDFGAVRRFQIIQECRSSVRCLLEAEDLVGEDRSRLERAVRDALGSEVEATFELVPAIPLTSAGKHQVVVNRLSESERREAA